MWRTPTPTSLKPGDKLAQPYPTPPSTDRRRPKSRVSQDQTSPSPTDERPTTPTPIRGEYNDILPEIIHEATLPSTGYFTPRTKILSLPPSPTLSPLNIKSSGKSGNEMENKEGMEETGVYWEELKRLERGDDLTSATITRTRHIGQSYQSRPSSVLRDAWWTVPFIHGQSRIKTTTPPLFLRDESEGESEREDHNNGDGDGDIAMSEVVSNDDDMPRLMGSLVRHESRVTIGSSQLQARPSTSHGGDLVRSKKRVRPTAQAGHSERSNQEGFEENLEEDIEITGWSHYANPSQINGQSVDLPSNKRVKLEIEAPSDPPEEVFDLSQSREDTPIQEVPKCEKCGCGCAGSSIFNRRARSPSISVGSGQVGQKGGWSSKLSRKSQAKLLELLIGGPSLRVKLGNKVECWADIATLIGADRGMHDNVRAVAKRMQEKLPEMMLKGQI